MRGKMIAGAAVAGIAGLVPAVSQAVPLTFDLRLAVNSQDGNGAKLNTTAINPGNIVTLDLYAVIENGNANTADDGFQRTNGSFKSTATGPEIKGTFRGDTGTEANTQTNNVNPFKGTTAVSGRQSDLDGDGDLDVGSLVTSGSVNPFPWFEALSNTNTTPQLGSGGPGNLEQLIGQVLFTVGVAGQATSLNYVPRLRTDGGVSGPRLNLFRLDGVDYALNAAGTGVKGGSTAVTGGLAVGSNVVLGLIPEPASLGLLGIGAVALLRRRKA